MIRHVYASLSWSANGLQWRSKVSNEKHGPSHGADYTNMIPFPRVRILRIIPCTTARPRTEQYMINPLPRHLPKDELKTIPFEKPSLPCCQAATLANFSLKNGNVQMNFTFYMTEIGNSFQKILSRKALQEIFETDRKSRKRPRSNGLSCVSPFEVWWCHKSITT